MTIPLTTNDIYVHGVMEQNRVLQHMNDEKGRKIALLEKQIETLKKEVEKLNHLLKERARLVIYGE